MKQATYERAFRVQAMRRSGLSNRLIAKQLGCTERTVSRYANIEIPEGLIAEESTEVKRCRKIYSQALRSRSGSAQEQLAAGKLLEVALKIAQAEAAMIYGATRETNVAGLAWEKAVAGGDVARARKAGKVYLQALAIQAISDSERPPRATEGKPFVLRIISAVTGETTSYSYQVGRVEPSGEPESDDQCDSPGDD